MKKALLHLFSGRDNATLDIGRVAGFWVVLCFTASGFYALYRGQPFDPMAWGGGAGATLGGVGALLKLKENTEPVPSPAAPPNPGG